MRLDPTIIRQQVEGLKQSHPELWDDDEKFLADVLEGQTDLIGYMRHLETTRQNACAMADDIGALIEN